MINIIENLCPYPAYWPGQKEIIKSIYNGFSDHKFVALVAPTGAGKSLIATIVSKLKNKAIYCTPQVGLVEQIRFDRDLGWSTDKDSASLTGKHNYTCLLNERVRCDNAECEFIRDSELKKIFYSKHRGKCYSTKHAMAKEIPGNGCRHRYHLQKAIHADRTVMTFQLLMTTISNPVYGKAWDRPLLIIDEAQDVDNWIRMFHTVTLKPKLKKIHDEWDDFWIEVWNEIKKEIPYNEDCTNLSTDWEQHSIQLQDKILPLLESKISDLDYARVNMKDRIKSQPFFDKSDFQRIDNEYNRNMKKIDQIISKIRLIAGSTTPFVPSPIFKKNGQNVDYNPRKDQSGLILDNISYVPLFVNGFFQRFAYPYTNVLLMGATITDCDLKELGIQNCLKLCPPHSFPIRHRQIFQVFCGNMKYGKDNGNTRDKIVVPNIANKIISIIEETDRNPPFDWDAPVNSIVHCVSGRLQNQLKELLPKGKTMITPINDAVLKDKVIKTFKKSKGKILLGSSFMTGYDFPDDAARLNFIPKIPYLPLNDPFVNARKKQKDGRQWYCNKATTQIIQASGRATRNLEDSSYTYILDSGFRALTTSQFPEFILEAIV